MCILNCTYQYIELNAITNDKINDKTKFFQVKT